MQLQVTKFIHSCLLAETPDRAALFDPGTMSAAALDVSKLQRLDDIFITHIHADHYDPELIKQLVAKFPEVRITTTPEVVAELAKVGITASDQPSEGVTFFDSPHESIYPPRPTPQETGFHYLETLSHPGDSHSFHETKSILALPMTAPWGTNIRAFTLAQELKPQHVLPIHDWHWRDEARDQTYNMFEKALGDQGITFHKLQTGQPIQIDV
jgi:L-ascorbate metabolism protein UlaG (beta-lactamase superfamily)